MAKKKYKPAPGSLGDLVLQVQAAIESRKAVNTDNTNAALCPRCHTRPRVYSNGRLYSYCGVCRKEKNHELYERKKL